MSTISNIKINKTKKTKNKKKQQKLKIVGTYQGEHLVICLHYLMHTYTSSFNKKGSLWHGFPVNAVKFSQ